MQYIFPEVSCGSWSRTLCMIGGCDGEVKMNESLTNNQPTNQQLAVLLTSFCYSVYFY